MRASALRSPRRLPFFISFFLSLSSQVRAGILRLLSRLPIDLDQPDRREQMKKSGLGKVVMFLSKLPEETAENRKAAQQLVEAWMRPIYALSTRFEDLKRLQASQPSPAREGPGGPLPF